MTPFLIFLRNVAIGLIIVGFFAWIAVVEGNL